MSDPTTGALAPDLELAQHQQVLYGTFVANKPIDIGGGRAFNPGDAVPVSHVERGVVSLDDVDRVAQETATAFEPDDPPADPSAGGKPKTTTKKEA